MDNESLLCTQITLNHNISSIRWWSNLFCCLLWRNVNNVKQCVNNYSENRTQDQRSFLVYIKKLIKYSFLWIHCQMRKCKEWPIKKRNYISDKVAVFFRLKPLWSSRENHEDWNLHLYIKYILIIHRTDKIAMFHLRSSNICINSTMTPSLIRARFSSRTTTVDTYFVTS